MDDEGRSGLKVDTLGIPIRELKEEPEPNLLEEAEGMAKHHVTIAVAIGYFVVILVFLIFRTGSLGLFDLFGAGIAAFFIFWTGFMSDTFVHYKLISMTAMLLVYLMLALLL